MHEIKILDLFCAAGGAGYGFGSLGFCVVGVDIIKQPRYPFEFIQADAFEFLKAHSHEFDYIHASPPCQRYSKMTTGRWKHKVSNHPDLIGYVRELLIKSGKPFDIENVPEAPLINPIILCGTMFGLSTKCGAQLRRHRAFETNWDVGQIPECNHKQRNKDKASSGLRIPSTVGVYGHSGGSSKRDNIVQFNANDRRDAMGIQWMSMA